MSKRKVQKKKSRVLKKAKLSHATVNRIRKHQASSPSSPTTVVSTEKARSLALKKQARERLVLKKHIAQLEERRRNTKRGESAKTERREMGKYIRHLLDEQREKHTAELAAIEARKASTKATEEACTDSELREMFSHLT